MHEIDVNANVLGANQTLALENRELFSGRGIYVFNLMSGPGAGKTTLLERTIVALKERFSFAVIEGDVQSDHDARKIGALGIPVVQINTGGACHLDARQVHNHLGSFDLDRVDCLVIENVGNLVCPAGRALGEHINIVIASVPEGDDKPYKYPGMFLAVDAVVINKIDLLPYLDFDLPAYRDLVIGLNPGARIFEVSCTTGQGLEEWAGWLMEKCSEQTGQE